MLPYLTSLNRSTTAVVDLKGLNLTGTLSDGEWEATQNMDAHLAPIVTRREKRLMVGRVEKPNGMMATDKLAFVDGTKFYYDGYYYGDVEDSFKQMVAMGSKICIFPDKRYFDTQTRSFGEMEQKNRTEGEIKITLAQADGSAYPEYTASAQEPQEPVNGDYWLDISSSPAVMKCYSDATAMWVEEATTFVCVEAAGIGVGLNADDGVSINGFAEASLNGDWVLMGAEEDRIIYTGMIPGPLTQTAQVTVERTCPTMDFVVSHNNRLWGCSSEEHEIYACALGDPTNWRRYAGLSTDSYAVTVGTAGDFTGAAVVNSSVIFTKENCLHKLYGTMPANYQLTEEHYRGAERGSGTSLVRVNELLYFKSVFDVCVYDGVEVQSISAALGREKWKNAVSGVNDRQLYISMEDAQGQWSLLVYDTTTGLWMQEDNTHAVAFAQCLTETFMMDANGSIWALKAGEYSKDFFMLGSDYKVEAVEEADADVPWMLRTGELCQSLPNNKHIGRIQWLIELGEGAKAEISIKKDNEAWQVALEITAEAKRRYTLPIYPKRCDRLQIMIQGQGPVKVINYSRMLAAGSEYGR